jgi:hypothetical protein
MLLLVALIAIVGVAVLVVWMVLARHPEDAASHEIHDPQGSDRYYGFPTDRPAGPDAEGQYVADRGEISSAPPPRPDR